MVEEKIAVGPSRSPSPVSSGRRDKAQAVNDIRPLDQQRVAMPSAELNRVLGGGLVAGSLVLLGGEPGIGKSTLCFRSSPRPSYMYREKKAPLSSNCAPTASDAEATTASSYARHRLRIFSHT